MGVVPSGPLLRVESNGRAWGIPLNAVERVTRAAEFPVDRDGAQALIHDDIGPVPLVSLGGPVVVVPHQRMVWLRTDEDRIAVLVDVVGDQVASSDLHPLPALPFSDPPPILGLAGDSNSALPVLDFKQLSSPLPAPGRPPGRVSSGRGTTESQKEPALMLLPVQPAFQGLRPLVPAISAAQVLGIETVGEVTPLPSLPPWCLGVGWWRGAPVGVFDVRRRLAGDDQVGEGRRWLVAAVAKERVVLQLDGRCSVAPLPERATVAPAQGALGEAIYGLFETPEHRLALLDLERWQRAGA